MMPKQTFFCLLARSEIQIRFPLIGRPAIQRRRRPFLVVDDATADDHAQ
jgi:hypothetical protein